MQSIVRILITTVFVVAIAAHAEATPIVYDGSLFDGVTSNGINSQPPGSGSNPSGADYWQFFATAGDAVTVFGDRLAGHYDMSLWIFAGLYADTDDFGPAFPGAQAANSIAFGDDQDPPNIAGPFGDPNVAFLAPVTGFYTVAVTNFLSNGDPPNPYTLTLDISNRISAVPEPASMLLLGSGVTGLIARRRMRKTRVQ